MRRQDLFDRGLKKFCSALSITAKPQHKRPHSPGCSPTPDFIDVSLLGETQQLKIMGKSNKFDYSNRPNSGAKLGSIIGRDIEKEADKVVKDVERRARKSSTASSISAIGSLDITEALVHPLDIKAPSKQLGDEGACALAAGLEAALKAGTTRSAAVLLEDLNLSDNAITTITLAQLGPVIQRARYDLKTLNLANNNIRVENDQEAADWEIFLRSFEHCLKMRRLDLSGNRNLGARALEILARVHAQEPQINPVCARGDTSVISLDNEETHCQDEASSAHRDDAMTSGGIVKRRCGLRGIPYLTFTNVGLNDTGALWLSYVLEEHHYPIQLIDFLNATAANSGIKTYAQEAASLGLDWSTQEPLLSKDGVNLLKKTEAVRRQLMFDDGSIIEASMTEGLENTRARTHDRRGSIRSIATADGGEHELSELESLRTKLVRHIIADTGVAQVELWHTGLRAAISATVLTGLGPRVRDRNPAVFYTGPPLFRSSSTCNHPQPGNETRLQTPSNSSHGSPKSPGASRQGTYAHTLTATTIASTGEPELALTEVTNTPTTPRMIFKPHRKGAFSDGSDLQAVNQKLESLDVGDNGPHRFVRWQEDMMERRGGSCVFRNTSVPSHLPKHLMDRIVGYTVTERKWQLLAEKQRRAVCAWGQNRNNFGASESWRKMPASSQVVSLLEVIECQSYRTV